MWLFPVCLEGGRCGWLHGREHGCISDEKRVEVRHKMLGPFETVEIVPHCYNIPRIGPRSFEDEATEKVTFSAKADWCFRFLFCWLESMLGMVQDMQT